MHYATRILQNVVNTVTFPKYTQKSEAYHIKPMTFKGTVPNVEKPKSITPFTFHRFKGHEKGPQIKPVSSMGKTPRERTSNDIKPINILAGATEGKQVHAPDKSELYKNITAQTLIDRQAFAEGKAVDDAVRELDELDPDEMRGDLYGPVVSDLMRAFEETEAAEFGDVASALLEVAQPKLTRIRRSAEKIAVQSAFSPEQHRKIGEIEKKMIAARGKVVAEKLRRSTDTPSADDMEAGEITPQTRRTVNSLRTELQTTQEEYNLVDLEQKLRLANPRDRLTDRDRDDAMRIYGLDLSQAQTIGDTLNIVKEKLKQKKKRVRFAPPPRRLDFDGMVDAGGAQVAQQTVRQEGWRRDIERRARAHRDRLEQERQRERQRKREADQRGAAAAAASQVAGVESADRSHQINAQAEQALHAAQQAQRAAQQATQQRAPPQTVQQQIQQLQDSLSRVAGSYADVVKWLKDNNVARPRGGSYSDANVQKLVDRIYRESIPRKFGLVPYDEKIDEEPAQAQGGAAAQRHQGSLDQEKATTFSNLLTTLQRMKADKERPSLPTKMINELKTLGIKPNSWDILTVEVALQDWLTRYHLSRVSKDDIRIIEGFSVSLRQGYRPMNQDIKILAKYGIFPYTSKQNDVLREIDGWLRRAKQT